MRLYGLEGLVDRPRLADADDRVHVAVHADDLALDVIILEERRFVAGARRVRLILVARQRRVPQLPVGLGKRQDRVVHKHGRALRRGRRHPTVPAQIVLERLALNREDRPSRVVIFTQQIPDRVRCVELLQKLLVRLGAVQIPLLQRLVKFNRLSVLLRRLLVGVLPGFVFLAEEVVLYFPTEKYADQVAEEQDHGENDQHYHADPRDQRADPPDIAVVLHKDADRIDDPRDNAGADDDADAHVHKKNRDSQAAAEAGAGVFVRLLDQKQSAEREREEEHNNHEHPYVLDQDCFR